MSDRLRESVSALMDGEADALELRRLLTDENYADTRATWMSFQRAHGSLTGVDAAIAQLDISARVQAALVDESMPAQRNADTWRWWRPVASVAVAASMAAVVVVGMRGFSTADTSTGLASVNTADSRVASATAVTGDTASVAAVSPNAGKVYAAALQPGRGSSTVSFGGMPSGAVTQGQVYGPVLPNAEAEIQARRRLQQYLLLQAERASAGQSAPR